MIDIDYPCVPFKVEIVRTKDLEAYGSSGALLVHVAGIPVFSFCFRCRSAIFKCQVKTFRLHIF